MTLPRDTSQPALCSETAGFVPELTMRPWASDFAEQGLPFASTKGSDTGRVQLTGRGWGDMKLCEHRALLLEIPPGSRDPAALVTRPSGGSGQAVGELGLF